MEQQESENRVVEWVAPLVVDEPAPTHVLPPSPHRTSGVLVWLLAMLVILAGVGMLAPRLAEEIQYALNRGKQRADHELASHMLVPTTLADLSQASQMVALKIIPSVVIINVNSQETPAEPLTEDELLERFHPRSPEALGQGSGVVISEDGYILTNYHVVRDSKAIEVTLSDGRRLPGKIVGVDNLTDLAVLKVGTTGLVPAEWGDSDKLQIGSLIWAMGSPFGLERSMSFGILSAKNRGGIAGSPHQDFLQTDAAVNPGNSGGPLIDASGRVVGINTAIVGQTYSGISFAVPSNVAREVADRLRAGGYVPRGWLGVELASVTEQQAKALGLSTARGAFIARVVDDSRNSPAQQAGMVQGDVVLRWNGIDVTSPSSLSQLVARTEIGTTVKVDVVRRGQPATLDVTVTERPRGFN